MEDILASTKFGVWRVKPKAIEKVNALKDLLGISFERAVEIIVSTPELEAR
jgi:hypothetical protein